MSEKRFAWKVEKLQHLDDEVLLVVDNENKDWKGHILNIVDVLNTQQATIQELERKLNKYAKIGEEQLKQIMELQDLCGKSDYENAKLREEVNLLRPTNLEQYEQIQKLQEENEKLRKELNDCEKFRYTTFKRMRDVLDE